LYTHLLRMADECAAPLVFAENVSNLLSASMEKAFCRGVKTLGAPCGRGGGARIGESPQEVKWARLPQAMRIILDDFAGKKFDVCWTTIKGKNVGCPMHRERIFLLACRKNSLKVIHKLREVVPAPLGLDEMRLFVQEPWNGAAPPVHEWLFVSRPPHHTERLSMMGNAVQCLLTNRCPWMQSGAAHC